jgi:hypothetical protein
MTRVVRIKARAWAPGVLVAVVLLLSLGTIRNQLAINMTNERIQSQARAGQQSLNRTCRLLPVSKKVYGDMLERDVISPTDYALVLSTANTVCP